MNGIDILTYYECAIIPLLSPIEDREKGGKRPRFKDWQKQFSRDHKQIKSWQEKWPQTNFGLLPEQSEMVVVDIDTYNGGDVDTLGLSGLDMMTMTSKTPNGGLHLFYAVPENLVIPYGREIYPAIELPRMVVIPPSIVRAVKTDNELRPYEWIAPPEIACAPLPETIIGLIKQLNQPQTTPHSPNVRDLHPYVAKALNGEIDKLRATPEGNRNRQLNASARDLANFIPEGGISEKRIIDELTPVARQIGLDDREIERTIQSGINYGIKRPRKVRGGGKSRNEPPSGTTQRNNYSGGGNGATGPPPEPPNSKDYPLTEFGNAERFVAQHGDELRYCFDWKCWLVWNGQRWVKDKEHEVFRRAKQTIRSIYQQASQTYDSAERTKLATWAIRSEKEKMTRDMVSLARGEGLSISPDKLDCHKWVLNCENGMLNLKDGKLYGHHKDNYLTKMVNASYNPDAKCPRWVQFLDEIFGCDEGLIGFVQRAIGYTLTGDVSGQCFFFCHGSGANGKSVFIETIQGIMGRDYSCSIRADSLMLRDKSRAANNDIAKLRGSRFVTSNETNEGQRLDESLIKQVTGKDTITARFLYGEEFDFVPEFKLWIRGNHKPRIEGVDDGIWRRVMFVPFTQTIPANKCDPYLADRLKNEYDGILAWAVRGTLEYLQAGLRPPEVVLQANQEYRTEMDEVGRFLAECSQPTGFVSAKNLYDRYESWSYAAGGQPRSKTWFGRKMTSKGFSREPHPQTRTPTYLGVSLVAQTC